MEGNQQLTSTLARGLQILEVVAEIGGHRGANLAEVVEASGQNRSTVYRYLTTLCELGWVERDDETFRYRLGLQPLQMAAAALQQIDVRSIARPLLEELSQETGLTVHLSVLHKTLIVYLDKVEVQGPIQMRSRPGVTAPCHSTSAGKAMLATMSVAELAALLPELLEARTSHTFTDRKSLLLELERVRQRGYATDREENEDGIACVAAALFGYDDQMIGAISLSGLAHQFSPERVTQLGCRVIEVAAQISRRMGCRNYPLPVSLRIAEPAPAPASR